MGVRCVLAVAGIFVFSWMTAGAYATGADRLFEELREGQSVRVVFNSTGCFHNETHEFVFRRAPALTATIARVQTKWDDAKKEKVETGRTALGTVNVSDDEAAGLDRLLQFYRGPKPNAWSTTVDHVSVTLRDGEKVVSEEHFSDNSSQTGYIDGLTFFSDLTDKLLGKPKRVVMPDPMLEREKELKKAMVACQQLAGYEHFIKSFEITNAIVGSINSMPESLFVDVKTMRPALIDAAWWWNPLADGKPSLAWGDFLKVHADAEAAMSKHPWLRDWKNLPGRSLEIHLLGRAMGEDSDKLKTDVIPLWRHAGFSGEPAYSFLARRNNRRAWVAIYFSDMDERALMVSNSNPDPESPSMMERADVYWFPNGKLGEKYSRYAIIENDGSCHVETFVGDEAKK